MGKMQSLSRILQGALGLMEIGNHPIIVLPMFHSILF